MDQNFIDDKTLARQLGVRVVAVRTAAAKGVLPSIETRPGHFVFHWLAVTRALAKLVLSDGKQPDPK